LGCGEIKGGTDPAGADEHWKTATTAFTRIRTAFKNKKMKCPELFFLGAAIEETMAKELYEQLQGKQIAKVANLTKQEQIDHLVSWLLSL
jgi:hypothetical protein